jgi:hypothetical protein
MSRDGTRQPTKAGSSINTSTSMASPSSARVEGTKPKSYGKNAPAASTPPNLYSPCFLSHSNLLRLPLGVSMMTLSVSVSSESNGGRWRGSVAIVYIGEICCDRTFPSHKMRSLFSRYRRNSSKNSIFQGFRTICPR